MLNPEKKHKPPLPASIIESNKALVDANWIDKIHGNKKHSQLRAVIIELATVCGRKLPPDYWERI